MPLDCSVKLVVLFSWSNRRSCVSAGSELRKLPLRNCQMSPPGNRWVSGMLGSWDHDDGMTPNAQTQSTSTVCLGESSKRPRPVFGPEAVGVEQWVWDTFLTRGSRNMGSFVLHDPWQNAVSEFMHLNPNSNK